MRDVQPVHLMPGQVLRLGEGVLKRAQHEGQRSAKLVTDVGKEGGLGLVDLGQRFGAATLFLIGGGIGDGRADLATDQRQETAIAVVEQPEGVQPGDENARVSGVEGAGDRHQRDVGGRLVPTAREVRVDLVLRYFEVDDIPALHCLGQGPDRVTGAADMRRCQGMVRAHARGAGAAEGAIVLQQIECSEWNVARGLPQGRAAAATGLVHGPGVDGPGGKILERGDLAFADNALGVVRIGTDDPAGAAVVIRDRAVGEGVIGLFRVAVPLHY